MGKVIKGRFRKVKAKVKAKKRASATKVKAREPKKITKRFLTITHDAVLSLGPCRQEWRKFCKVFPKAEFGKRGIPITLANAMRALKGDVNLNWVLYRFTQGGYMTSEQFRRERYALAGRRASGRTLAQVFVNLISSYPTSLVGRVTARAPRANVTTLKGLTLAKAA